MEINAATSRLIKILGQMGQASQDALSAGVAGNETTTREAVDKLRGLQAKLGTIDSTTRETLNKLPESLQLGVREAIAHIQSAEGFVQAWSKRYRDLTTAKELATSVEGRHAILDYTLPNDWNFDADVFLLFDKEELSFAPQLIQRGQKRILYVGECLLNSEDKSTVITAHDATELRSYFLSLNNPLPLRLAHLTAREREDHKRAWQDIKHAFTLLHSNFHTTKVLGGAWMTQGLRNLHDIAQSAHLSALKGCFKGLPVVIISPGPSLDKNIHLLKEIKGRAVLMAAAQCARALQAAGVIPDFLVVADPGNLVYFLEGVDTSVIDALIVGVSSHPGFYKKPFKNIITFNANANVDAWVSNIFGDPNTVTTAGSVSIDCYFIARYLECSHIIMVGLDLALLEGKTYSSKSANGESVVNIDSVTNTLTFSNVSEPMEQIFLAKGATSEDTVEHVLLLPGYYGGTVQTRANYHLFHGEFEVIAQNENKKDSPIPLINCTEGGAYIEGFEHIPLEEAIKRHIKAGEQHIAERIVKACAKTNNEVRSEQCEIAKKSVVANIKSILTLVDECRKYTKLKNANQKQLTHLNKKEKELIRTLGKTPFISLPNVNEVKKSLEMSGDATTVKETNRVAEFIYDTIEVTSKNILTILEDV